MPDTPSNNRFVVIARDGLKLRGGPSIDFGVVRTIPTGTVVNVLSRENMWALVDLEADGKADGFMSLPFLRPVDTEGAAATALGATLPALSRPRW
jgi:Bacterial SH3 domain